MNRESEVILAIESTSTTASIALVNGSHTLGEYTVNHPKTHSQKLMAILGSLMGELGMTMNDVDLIAVSSGPGSFTGIRIGLATAKGLAHPDNLPVIEVSTLLGLAFNLYGYDGLVCAMIDARRDEVYTRVVRFEDGFAQTVVDDCVINVFDLIGKLRELAGEGEPIAIVGDGVSKHGDMFREELGSCLDMGIPSISHPRASSVASAAMRMNLERKSFHDIDANYIRKSEAEETREKMRLKASRGE